MDEDIFSSMGELLKKLKDKSEITVSLAYAGLLYGSRVISNGALQVEDDVDEIRLRLQELILRESDTLGVNSSIAVMLLAEALESISDTGKRLAMTVIEEVEPHPVLDLVDDESEEQVLLLKIDQNSIFRNHAIKDLAFDDKMGVRIIAVKHKGKWVFDPDEQIVLNNGDHILLTGYKAGIEVLEESEEEVEEE